MVAASRNMFLAGGLFLAAALVFYVTGQGAMGAAFLALGVAFVAIGAVKRKDGN